MSNKKTTSTIVLMLTSAFLLPILVSVALWYIDNAQRTSQAQKEETIQAIGSQVYMLHAYANPTPAVISEEIDPNTLTELQQIKLEEAFETKEAPAPSKTQSAPTKKETKTDKPNASKSSPTITPSMTIPVKITPTPKKTPKMPPTSNVLILSYEPNIGDKTIYEYYQWENATTLSKLLIKKLNTASQGAAHFRISQIIRIKDFPTKIDGFKYSEKTYLMCLRNRSTCHNPDRADYNLIFIKNNVCSLVEQNKVSEVWLWGGPYFGYPGYVEMVCRTQKGNIKVPVQGFNYERRDWEVHMFVIGMRITSILRSTFSQTTLPINLFDVFALTSPKGIAGCGTYYYAPNSRWSQDFGNKNYIRSYCQHFNSSYDKLIQIVSDLPNGDINKLKDLIAKRLDLAKINCDKWNCNPREYYLWLYSQLPRGEGKDALGLYKNWWNYIVNPNVK